VDAGAAFFLDPGPFLSGFVVVVAFGASLVGGAAFVDGAVLAAGSFAAGT